MSKPVPNAAGLEVRLSAADRLAGVLRGGNFSPFTAADIGEARDRALANRLVTTALRYHGPISALMAELLRRGVPRKSGRFEAMLRLSLGQLLALPELGDHSAIFLAAEAMRRDPRTQHLVRLMNGVLREAQRRRTPRAFTADSLFPALLLDKWRDAYGNAAVERFAAALLAGAPLDVTLRGDDPGLGGAVVLGDTVRIDERDRPVEQLPGYGDGAFWVQDAAAAIPARLMGLDAGARVLDLCAAPGGKTAQLLKRGYRVTALDREAERMARLGDNLARLGYSAELVTADALDYAPEAPFDGVLLDAPCSATGTFRRHPEVTWHRSAEDVKGRMAVQRQLLERAMTLVRPGGVLVYCVCSLEPEEGEAQAQWALARGLESLTIDAQELDGWAGPVTQAGFVRTHPGLTVPGDKGGTLDGFFVARFRRR